MENKNKIVVAQIMGKWLGGGVESVIMNYYRNIDRNKVQFDFICDSDSTMIPYDEIKESGGKVILVPPYQHIFSYIKELRKVFKENKYKIVHSNINTLSVFPLYAAKKENILVRIAHSHSTSNKKEWKKNILKNILRPFSKKYATHYFACSELAGRYLFGNKTFDKGLVTIINNAIDINKFKYNEKVRIKKRKELNIKDDTLVIGHIGRFMTQKNHTFLIDVFNDVHKKNKNSMLILVGTGPLMNEIKEKVDSLNLTNSVMFLGQRSDANELYQAFDVFLFPSLYEGLGMVLIEAQATGCYCVASTEVPNIAKICNNFEFIDLNKNYIYWADKVLEKKIYIKKSIKEELFKTGFDIKYESIKLQDFYMEVGDMND